MKDAIKNAPKDKVPDLKKAYNDFKASKNELNEAKEKHTELKNIKTMDQKQRTLYANDKRLNAAKNVGTSLWITGSVIGMAFPPAGAAIASLGGAVFLGSTAVKAVNNMRRSAYSASIPSNLQKNLQTQIQEFTSKHEDTKELNNKLDDLFSKQDFNGIEDLVRNQMQNIKSDLESIQDTCQSIKEQVPVAQQEFVNGAIGALTDAISFVSFAFTFYGVAEAGAHLTSSNASSIGGESMKEAFSAESIKNQLDPMTLINNFKDINIGHALQEGSKEGLKELAEHAKDVAIHHTLMDGLDTFSEANEEAINETVSNLFFSNSATEAAQLSTVE